LQSSARRTMLGAMSKGDFLAVFALIGAFAFQVWVTLQVRRSSLYEASEKRAQLRFIWLVPVLGAAVSFAMLEKDDRPPQDQTSERS